MSQCIGEGGKAPPPQKNHSLLWGMWNATVAHIAIDSWFPWPRSRELGAPWRSTVATETAEADQLAAELNDIKDVEVPCYVPRGAVGNSPDGG